MSSPTIAELVAQSKQHHPAHHYPTAPKQAKVPKGATQPPTRFERYMVPILTIPVWMIIAWVLWQLFAPLTLRHPNDNVYVGLSLFWLITLEVLAIGIGWLTIVLALRKADKQHEVPTDQTEKEGSAS